MERSNHRTLWSNIGRTNEGLVRSWNNDQFIRALKRTLRENNVKKYDVSDAFEDTSIILRLNEPVPNGENLVRDLKTLMGLTGYYPVKGETYEKILSGQPKILIEFLKKYSVPVKKIPEKLYHVSHPHVQGKIDSQGLVPKSKKLIEDHPERIYFTTRLKDAIGFAKLKFEMTVKPEYEDFIIYEVTTPGLDIKLYTDPLRMPDTDMYYTMDNIPRANIEVVHDSRVKGPEKKHILTKLTDFIRK